MRITNPTPPKVGEMTDSKAEKRNASPPNKEVGLRGGDLKARTIIVKAKALHLVSHAKGPIKNQNANGRQQYMPSKKNLE